MKVPKERPLPMGYKSWAELDAETEARKKKDRREALIYIVSFVLVLLLVTAFALFH